MDGSAISKAVATGLGLALLLAPGAQAQASHSEDFPNGYFGGSAASRTTRQLLNRLDAALRHEDGSGRVISLAMTPGRDDSHQLCGVAVTREGRFSLFHVTDSLHPEGSLSLTPIAGTLNGLAVAHNDIYAQCGGNGRAVFLVDRDRILN